MDVPGLSVTIRPLASLTDPFVSVKPMKSINMRKDGYCVNIITDSEESVLKSMPGLCEKRKWEFVVRKSIRFMAG